MAFRSLARGVPSRRGKALLVLLLIALLWLWTARPSVPSALMSDAPFEGPSMVDTNKVEKILESESPVVVTGASSGFFPALANLVGSLRHWNPQVRIVMYDLGLTEEQRHRARSWCKTDLKWAGRLYGSYAEDPVNAAPFRSNLKTYSWKPTAIRVALQEHSAVLWIDAGSTTTGPLEPLFELLLQDGYFFANGQDTDMVRWVHPSMFTYFNVTPQAFYNTPHGSYSGNIMGFVRDSEAYRQVLVPLAECAEAEACIAPHGSGLHNHRYDQSALSILVYDRLKLQVGHTEFLAAERGQVKPCFEESELRVWTSRGSESCYASKAACA